jgi:tetratricopeptide (TPR) repeat protein
MDLTRVMPGFDETLAAATAALRQGRAVEAEAGLRRALAERPHALQALQPLLTLLQQAGRAAEARRLLDAALAACPDEPALHFHHGLLAMAARDWPEALVAFDRVLARNPAALTAMVNRGVALKSLDRVDEAIAAFEQALALRPDFADALHNLGVCQMRRGELGAALDTLGQAVALATGSAAVHHAYGNALRESGRRDEALAQFAAGLRLRPRDADLQVDSGLCLLEMARAQEAAGRLLQAVQLDPANQTALMGLYLAALECGQGDLAARLMDYGRLFSQHALFVGEEATRQRLVEAVLALPDLRADPLEQTTRKGQQSQALDTGEGSAFADLAARIRAVIEDEIERRAGDPAVAAHPWWRARPRRWHLSLWATVLHEGGHQRPHLHPAGWLSGVCYPQLGSSDDAAGSIEFGQGPDALPLKAEPLRHRHRPQEGELLLFPSFFLHRTLPYPGGVPRISIAFDLIADPA